MKKAFKVITLLMLVILVVTAFTMPASAKQVFTDLSPEHWCYAKIMDFEKKGYVCGYSDNTFRADRTITRAEYVKIVNNFFGYKPSEKTTSAFKDVNSGDWFMPYVNEAVDRGYIEGFEDGTFRPQDPIRRQEATVILARILKIDKEVYPADHKDGLAQYSDSDEVQEWARVAIHSYSVYNFINGYEDGTLRILRNVTRAETVELLHILEQKVVIDRKPGGGGTKTPTLKPDIDVLVRNLIEVPVENEIAIKEEYTPVIYTKSNWINKKNSNFEKETARNGAFVNITSQTRGSTIHDTVDVISRKEEYKTTKRDEYDNKFFLTDGVYTVTAQATKSGRKDSGIETKVVKIDTVAPVVRVVETSSAKGKIAHEQSVAVAIKDSNLYNANEISGLDKVAYAWFNADTDERVTVWSAFELVNGQAQINAPLTYGKYKLGIAAIDVAENAFGTRTEYAVKSEDISGDVPTTPSGDVDYDFVKETESGDENPDQNPNGEELIVIVGNNNPTIEDLTMHTTANKLVSGELKGKDIDSGDILSYVINVAPEYGTAEVNGNYTTYVSDKAGIYNYTVKVRDNHSGEAIGNVTVYVFDAEIAIPDAPSGEEIQDPVNPNNPVNSDLSGEKLVLFVGEEKEMTASVTPSYEDTTYDWAFDVSEEKAEISSNSDECTVKVKGLKPGETKITIKVKVNVKAPNGGTETLEIEKQIPVIVLSKITIKIPDATKAYDGIALKAEDFEVRSGDEALKAGVMADGDAAQVRVSGERLYVGSSDATLVGYDILDGNGNSVRKYYVPTFEKGTLTVTVNENEIIIKANSANKKYDGTALKNSGYTYTSGVLVSGDVLEAVVSGEQLNAGSGDNKVISYKVTRNSIDVTGNYTFGECVDGVLEVTKRKVTLTSASDVKQYDGTALTNDEITVGGDGFVNGEGATYTVTGNQTVVGSGDNEFTYTLNDGTLEDNYNITKEVGKLTVKAKEVTYTVKYYKENLSGDYELADTETKKVTLNNGTEKAEYDENKYTDGFEFKKVEPEDLTIPASGKLVVKVYFARKSYTLTLIAGENVKEVTGGSATSGEIILTVKYGEKVNIDATLKEIAGYEVNFDKWESTHGKDITKKNTTIAMPNSDLTLTAVATKEEKAPNVKINIKSDYPKNGKEAEPGDTIGYEATVKNEESRDIKVKIKIDSADEIDTIIVYNNDGKVVGTYGSLDETITIPADGRVKINYKSDVPNNHSVASDFESTVRVTPETGTKETRKTIENKIEKSATIVANNNKNKNVFLIVDLSKSMNEDGKIAALRTAATTFTNKLKTDSDSNGSDITLTLIGIGYGQGSDGTVTKTMYSTDGWNNKTYAYKMGFYTKDNWSKLSKFINQKNIWGDYTNFYAYGGTNITGALEITHEIIAAGNKYGANLLKDNADTFTVLLTDGGNGYDGMVDILPTNPDALYLQKNSTIFAIAFGKGAKKGTKGYNDLLAVTGSEQSIYSAASQTDLDKAFETIANKIGEQQSKQGKILVELPESGRYFPIIITYSQNGENKKLDIYTIEEAKAENIVIDEETKTLTWNLSGTKYSACEDLKLKLTLDNTATDGKSTEDTLELLSIESGETTVIVPVVDEKEDITSGDIDTSKENKTTVPGDTEIQNNDEAKSVSGEDQGLDNKDVELDNNENEQQNEEKKQEENVDDKEENQEVDNENQVNEVEGKQDEKVGDQKEDQKETKEEPKPEEDNNEEVIIEEKKEPMILEEKQDDDDSNDTSDSDKKIE